MAAALREASVTAAEREDFGGGLADDGEFIIGKASGDEKVVIEKVTLRNDKNKAQNNFSFGETLCVEIEFNALEDFQSPYVWIAIKNSRGPVTAASGLIDGFRSSYFSKGKNVVKCTFFNLPLLTGEYSIYMGARAGDGVTLLTESRDVAAFNVVSILSEVGLNEEMADTVASDTVSPVIPYEWEFNDGKKFAFNIKNYVK